MIQVREKRSSRNNSTEVSNETQQADSAKRHDMRDGKVKYGTATAT